MRPVDEPREDVGLVGRRRRLGRALDRDRLAERDRLLALADVAAQFLPRGKVAIGPGWIPRARHCAQASS